MFEIVKIILEIVAKALNFSDVSEFRKQKKLNELGKELFLLYTHLNEIIVCGESIINILEMYITRMEQHIEHGNDEYALTAGKWLEKNLDQQRINLVRFGRSVERLSRQLQVLDGESSRKLRPLLMQKASLLGTLIYTLSVKRLPTAGPTEIEIFELINKEKSRDEPLNSLILTSDNYKVSSVSLEMSWDRETYKAIKEYMRVYKPRKQLDEIRKVAEHMRTTLEQVFSIKDVLLKIGDKRLDAAEDKPFW